MKVLRASRFFRKDKSLAAALVIALLICLLCRYGGLWQKEELRWFDKFTQRAALDSSDRIVIVAITDKDIKKFPSFIPDDLTLAKTIKIIAHQQPRVIGLDLIRDLPVPPGSQDLQKVFDEIPNLYGIAKFTGIKGDPFFSKISPPYMIDDLNKVGDVSVLVDDDGIIRRANLYPTTGDSAIPSLGLLLAQKYLEQEEIIAEPGVNNRLRLGTAEFPIFRTNTGAYINTDEGGYQTLMRWSIPLQKFKQVSISEVLDNQISPDFFEDKIVLIGYWTTSLKQDLFYTPFSYVPDGKTPRQAFGVEAQANFSQYILQTVLDSVPTLKSLPEILEVIWLFSWGILSSLVMWRIRQFPRLKEPFWLISAGAILAWVLITTSTQIHFDLFKWGWWLPVASINNSLVIFVTLVLFFIFRERIRSQIDNLEKTVERRTLSLTQALETIKLNQTQLIEQEKLAFLGRLTAGFCHQFKNPLYQLKYGLITILESLDDETQDLTLENHSESIKLLKSLEEPIEKLEMIFKLILVSPSQQRVSYLEANPNEFVQSILLSVMKYHSSPLLSSQIQTILASELNRRLKIPQQLEIPLFNILENSCDALAEKQSQEYDFCPRLTLTTKLNETHWIISVEDNGKGIDPKIRENLFQPFTTTKTEVQGIGLGLYISHEIMERIGGKILVKSSKQGVKFILTIPKKESINIEPPLA